MPNGPRVRDKRSAICNTSAYRAEQCRLRSSLLCRHLCAHLRDSLQGGGLLLRGVAARVAKLSGGSLRRLCCGPATCLSLPYSRCSSPSVGGWQAEEARGRGGCVQRVGCVA